MYEFKFADIGEGIHEGVILEWKFKEGDAVSEGDTLVIVETDKVNAELPSPVTGKVHKINFKEGDEINVGQVIVVLDDGTGEAPAPKEEPKKEEAPKPKATKKEVTGGYEFKFADIGEGIHEGVILEWKFKEGDEVKEGDTLVIVETDKVNAELPAPVDGEITKINFKEGETVNVGQVLVVIGGEAGETTEASESKAAPVEEDDEKAAGVIGEIEVNHDVMASSNEHEEATPEKKTAGRALATPVARKLAKDLGVDIQTVKGTGANGRVMKDDIRKAAERASSKASTTVSAPKVTVSTQGEVELVKISSLRKAIVKAMTFAKQVIPHTVLIDEIVVDKLVDLRKQVKTQAAAQDIKLTYMAFITKAVVLALQKYPWFNASFDQENEQMVLKKFYNIGMAVDTPDGLIVPNIKDANQKSILELARDIQVLGEKTRNRKVQMTDIQNATFSITNFGAAGVEAGTPIINHPEVGILGVGMIKQKPVVVDGEIKVGYTLPLSLAVDHRVIDGADAGRFLGYIKELLSDPLLLLLN